MFDKKDSEKVHFLIPSSRILFGVCDPTETLGPNECHVRITVEGDGVRSLDGAWVVVARNPCLHPGDIRKLRVRRIHELDRLVDCIVFPITGNVPPPSMMSGGDLDGDKFFVRWDRELIPTNIHEPHFYPPAKEKPRHTISHDDLVRHFARYNNASLGRVKNLYLKWVRASDKGAACEECLELNYLFSCCVDGERILIPEKLLHPPECERSEPFVLDKLTEQVSRVQETLRFGLRSESENLDIDIIEFLAAADDICMSEFELYQLVCNWADKHNVSMTRFVDHFDFGAFTADQKSWVRVSKFQKDVTVDIDALLKNGLLQSEILKLHEVKQCKLDSPALHWRRLYSSYRDGATLFLPMLETALEDFVQKLIVLDVDTRLKVAILISKRIKPFETAETIVDDCVSAYSFRPDNTSTGRKSRTTTGFRLSWNGSVFQLFNSTRANTFIFVRKAEYESHGPLGIVSIALNRFGKDLARNVGQILRNPMQSVK